MKLVIDIPEDVKAVIDRNGTNEVVAETIWQAVKNGTPLPKGHGRLIDADAITKDLNTFQDAFVIHTDGTYRMSISCKAPTIIEKDGD